MNKKDKKIVKVFAISSFLNDLGSDMIYPVWPLFVTNYLHANMTALGLLDGLGEAIVSISQAISGYLSDRIKRRKVFIWNGYLFGSISRIGYGVSSSWQHLIPFKILDRFGKMRGAPRDAMVADASNRQNRGKNFGFLRAMDNLGAVFGITICIILINFINLKTLFFLAAIPSVISVFLILTFIKEKKLEKVKLYKGFSFKNASSNFKLYFLLSALFAIGSFSYSFLLIYAKRVGFQTAFIPVLYLIFTLVASVFSLHFGKLADRKGRIPILFLSYIFWVIICLEAIFVKSYLAVFTIFILYGLHKATLEPVQKAFVSELAPKEYRASVLGSFQVLVGLCSLPGSLIAGLLWDKISFTSPFYLSLTMTFASIFLLLFIKEK